MFVLTTFKTKKKKKQSETQWKLDVKLMYIYSFLFAEFQDTDVMQTKHILVAFPLLQQEFKSSKITCLLHLALFNIYYAVLHFPFWVLLQELILKWTNETSSGEKRSYFSTF